MRLRLLRTSLLAATVATATAAPLALAGSPASAPPVGVDHQCFAPAGHLRSRTSVVWIPRSDYPHGYGAKADGARVVSAPGASRLVLRTRPGARTVTLVVVR